MPVAALLPDAEAIVITYLLGRSEITDIAAGVGSRLRQTKVWPFLLVRRRGGVPRDDVAWLDAPIVQLDAFGGTQEQASALIRTAIAVLAEADDASHTGAVITGITPGPIRYLPDPELNDGEHRPRYSADVTVFIHPTT